MQPNRVLYQEFPEELSNAYRDAVRAREWSSKHKGLLDFAEVTLFYLASLSLSDYRTRCLGLADSVEAAIERSRKKPMTMGRLLNLFRVSAKAMVDPIVPPAAFLADAQLDDVRRFHSATAAIDTAMAGLSPTAPPSALNVAHHVENAKLEAVEAGDWWDSWDQVIDYRNRVAHAVGTHRWPTGSDGYWEVMGSLLHAALVEMLAQEAIVEAVLEHPVAAITLLSQNGSGDYTHLMCGEERGVLFETEIVAAMPVTKRWPERWNATTATPYVLDPASDGWTIHSPFWDLRTGLPPAIDVAAGSKCTVRGVSAGGKGAKRARAKEGRGSAPGTCGEFIQGVLPNGTRFHVSCPINMSSTVVAKLRPARQTSVTGLRDYQSKLALAIEYAVDELDVGPQEVTIWPWSDVDVGKGMGSSTADVLAGIRAVADAVGRQLGASEEGALAARVESSDGTMYPEIAAVNHKTCEIVKSWKWFPQFAIVMLVPSESVDTQSVPFTGQEELAEEYEALLANMDRAIMERSLSRFAEQSTRSAELNQRFLVNPYSRTLSKRLDQFGALGLNVGHTGTVCGLLFPNTEEGQMVASEACFRVKEEFGDLKDVKVVTTPHCSASSDGGAAGPSSKHGSDERSSQGDRPDLP